MSTDPAIRDHKAWLGYLQPDGLVVSPAALVDAQVLLDRNAAPLQQRFLDYVEEVEDDGQTTWAVPDLKALLSGFLEWPAEYLVGHDDVHPIPETLKAPLREFGETLEPTMAFREPSPGEDESPWLLLIQEFPRGTDLDVPVESAMAGWAASHTRRFERLLREAQVPIGLLSNSTHLRLVYAPRGENAGTVTFKVSDMTEVSGRRILSAFEMLFSSYRLLAAPSEARLPALLKRSRDYQARVSTTLAKQVLDALYELLRGFQVANDHTRGALLKDVLDGDPDSIYGAMLTVLMRLVFLLYAEDRGLMPGSDLYVRNYAIHSLLERLRNDAEHYPDTMDHRYGAWAQLAALFRAIHDGCEFPKLKVPARQGHLFDPKRFPFLEGKSGTVPSERVPERDAAVPGFSEERAETGLSPLSRSSSQRTRLPLVSDGVIYRVLDKLLILEGERLSYRTLDVEQIGSVYETMMGFKLQTAKGQSIALKPGKKAGAPVPINLEELLETQSAQRAKWVKDSTDPRPRPACRGFPRRPHAETDRRLPLGTGPAADFG